MSREAERVALLAEALKKSGLERPQVAIVLGSGLAPVDALLTNPLVIPYTELPGIPAPTVVGHGGKVLYGECEGVSLALLCGRVHLYEGHSPAQVVRLVRAFALLGTPLVILTNAAGGVNYDLKPGDLMLIQDHINLQGVNPFQGPQEPELGTRFPDQTFVYDRDVHRTLYNASGCNLPSGVYLGNPGPPYETPAEVRMARTLGADAVGMSTVQEAQALAAMRVKVGGISVIANQAAGMTGNVLTHDEVVEVVGRAAENLADLLRKALVPLAGLPKGG